MLEKENDYLIMWKNKDGFRICSKCKIEKPLTSEYFHKGSQKDKGFMYKCKPCNNANEKKLYTEYKEKHGIVPDREGNRRRHLNRKYGLKLEDIPNKCQVCGRDESFSYGRGGGRGSGRGRIAVDHHHDLGKIRGFLCYDCNLALGHVQDDPNLLRALADYLEKFNGSL